MKTSKLIISVFSALLVAAVVGQSRAQDFRENQDSWKVEMLRARGSDTIQFEQHSFFKIPVVSDTTPLVYHEPLPDSVMPKSAIEIGFITIQASNAEDVISMLERTARAQGADWIVGFNEPRLRLDKKGVGSYRSQAMLYKVINADLVPQSEIVTIDCGENHLQDCAAVMTFVKHVVAKSGE